MVVLAASICTHGGKALLSRLFRELSEDRITALLANFPSLLSFSGSQNTTVEDGAVRYVYQPLEEFYVVLLTNKQSNILQDIDTLHLFVSVVSNMVRIVDEKEIFDSAFEILGAFDEIVNLGYKERLTLLQVQTFLEMDSHEEKIQEIIERNKELEASEERRRRAKEIQRKELARRNVEAHTASFGAPSAPASSAEFGYNAAPPAPAYDTPQYEREVPAPRVAAGSGLKLGKKPARGGELAQPLLTRELVGQAPAPAPAQPAHSAPAQAYSAPAPAHSAPAQTASAAATASAGVSASGKSLNNGILISVNEKITAQLTREGGVSHAEVKGDLQLRVNDPQLAHAKILLQAAHGAVQYKTHPNVDRALFAASSIIGLKDKTKPFPSNDQSLGVLRWRAVANADDASLVPLLLTAWVGVDNGVANVTLEYELTPAYVEAHPTQDVFGPVQVVVPIPLDEVELTDSSSDSVLYDVAAEGVVFTIGAIALDEPAGSFEFSIPAYDEDALFPLDVQFDIARTDVTEADAAFGRISVVDVVSNDGDETSLPFDLHLTLASEGYVVS